MELSTICAVLMVYFLISGISFATPSANNTPPEKMKVAVVEFELKKAGSIVAE